MMNGVDVLELSDVLNSRYSTPTVFCAPYVAHGYAPAWKDAQAIAIYQNGELVDIVECVEARTLYHAIRHHMRYRIAQEHGELLRARLNYFLSESSEC